MSTSKLAHFTYYSPRLTRRLTCILTCEDFLTYLLTCVDCTCLLTNCSPTTLKILVPSHVHLVDQHGNSMSPVVGTDVVEKTFTQLLFRPTIATDSLNCSQPMQRAGPQLHWFFNSDTATFYFFRRFEATLTNCLPFFIDPSFET